MRRSAHLLLGLLGACFSVPTYESGILTCDDGQCPPDMECRTDNRCYFPGDVLGDGPRMSDAPVSSADGPLHTIDGPLPTADAPIIDAPRIDAAVPDAAQVDAPIVCSTGTHRCASGNLEVCQSGAWVAAVPSCADQGRQCFDPAPSGGTDAYCGTCLKGAERCVPGPPPTRQSCPAGTGVWTDVAPACDATLGCFDPDGDTGPLSYCGECVTGDKRCSGGLQTCVAGQWSMPENCGATAGWSCFDPSPSGGTDAYCGLCLKSATVCNGDSRDTCDATGTAYTMQQACSWGCMVSGCCAMPTCTGVGCGSSDPNTCGRSINCGDCNGHPDKCCDGFCCNAIALCCSGTCANTCGP